MTGIFEIDYLACYIFQFLYIIYYNSHIITTYSRIVWQDSTLCYFEKITHLTDELRILQVKIKITLLLKS